MKGMWKLWLLVGLAGALAGAELRGIVQYGGLPVPGASVLAIQGTTRRTALTDRAGVYLIGEVAEGTWTIQVEMQLFTTQRQEVAAGGKAEWALVRAEMAEPAIRFEKPPVRTAPRPAPATKKKAEPEALETDDGLLVNGSVNNGAASPFAQLPAFGNNRKGQRSQYNGNLGFILNNALFDARAFSLTGQNTAKPDYSQAQGLASFGGPVKIPGLLERNGPVFSVNYQWTRNRSAAVQTGLVPTAAQRDMLMNPPAIALVRLYPLPNFLGSSRYNYQTAVVNGLHQDDLQARLQKSVRRNSFSGSVAWQRLRTDSPDLFGFLDTGRTGGGNVTLGYRRSFNPRTYVNVGTQVSWLDNVATPYFAGRQNVSGMAGVNGNNQDPVNWGPPGLEFSSGITALRTGQAANRRNQTIGLSLDGFASRGKHNVSGGGTYRRQQFNLIGQEDARGTFVFTDDDWTKFGRGTPDTATIAFGNADKYLRGKTVELFGNDDWRVSPALTINAGLRWEYWSPLEEKYGRLVNVSGAQPRPDGNNVSPRVGIAWRPWAAASTVVRGGYGIYYDTSVYLPVALRMAQQAPFSRSIRVTNSAAWPLTLADGFPAGAAAATFGVDPNFRLGYAQSWQLSLQTDLPGALQVMALYQGTKGTRGQQQVLPFTFPDRQGPGAGHTHLSSEGNSNRQAGILQVRRRLRSGFTAAATYTWAKAIDNSALGGRGQGATLVAQNWLDLRAERGRSNFDQRHGLSGIAQYTTGMGRNALLRGKWLSDWTVSSQWAVGTGLPLTPVLLRPVAGTGVTGSWRPDYTGAELFAGSRPNPAAYAVPGPGRWGNAGRNTITGPKQLAVNAALSRTFRANDKLSWDFRVEATNALNNVTFPGWNTVVGNAQFGLPMTSNPMRRVQVLGRLRF